MAGFVGLLMASCSGDDKIKAFAEEFATAVANGDRASIIRMYPDAEKGDSLAVTFNADSVGNYATVADAAQSGCYDKDTIKKWLTTFCRRFFAQQFKRSCLPDGPKVGSVSLSPRGDWRMPSDATSTVWLQECEGLS